VAVADAGEAEAQARKRVGRVELDRLLEGGRGFGGPHLRQVREAEDRLGTRQVRLEAGRLVRGFERRTAQAERRTDLGETRPGERVGGVELDGLLEAGPRSFEVELRLLRVRQGDLRRGRLRVGGDRLPRGREGVRAVGRHAHDRLESERIGVVRVRLERVVQVLRCLVHAADREPGGGALAGSLGRAGLGEQHRRVVERPLHRVLRTHARGDGRSAARGGRRHLTGLEHLAAGVVPRLDAPLDDRELGLVAVGRDHQAQLGATDRGDRAAAAEAGRPLPPADHVRPDAAEEELDVPLRCVLVDLHARLGGDPQHRAVGQEAHARAALARDQHVAELERHRRRRRLRLPEAQHRDLSGCGLQRGDGLGRSIALGNHKG
jgi:hypothetical protein